MTRPPPRLVLALLGLSTVVADGVAAGPPGEVAGPAAVEVSAEVAALNGSFDDLAHDFGAVESGGLVIALSSPRNRLTVHRNRLSLRPAAGAGLWVGLLEVELEADGDVEAEVEGTGGTIRDRLVAARQTVRVASTLRLERGEGGYRVTLVDPPASVPVEVESGLGSRLVGVCDGLAIFLGLDCGDLERSLRTVDVPLPEAGEAFVVPDERLSEEERAFFDARLAGR